MGLFEDTLLTLKSAANVAVEKTEKIIDGSKLKISLTEQNNKLSKCFEELGRLTYNASRNDNASDEEKDSIMGKIDDIYGEIKEISDQIALSKNQIRCEKCGYDNDSEMLYCGRCGSLLKDEPDSI